MRLPVMAISNTFQSTLSVRRATDKFLIDIPVINISIHALRKESDPRTYTIVLTVSLFQSTLSVRRATFIPNYLISSDFVISIHALRKESDRLSKSRHAAFTFISIHALRKESDQPSCLPAQAVEANFNPRSP